MTASTSPPRSKRRWSSWSALIGYLLIGLGIAELALRNHSLGQPRYSSFLRYQEVFPPSLVPDERADGLEVLRTTDPRHPYQWVPAKKEPGSLRVLCFGGSATVGLGHSPNVTFARHLQVLLEKAYPERTVEVINLGVVAISSKQVRELVDDALDNADPDLLVVYSGNNEFLEVHAQRYGELHDGLKGKMQRGLRSLALVRALENLSQGAPTFQDLPDRRPGQTNSKALTEARIIEDVHLDSSDLDATVQSYADNMKAMQAAAVAAEVPALFCTVAVNWNWSGKSEPSYDWDPGDTPKSLNKRLSTLRELGGDASAASWQQQMEAVQLAIALGDTALAGELMRAALEMDPHRRRATLRQGQALKSALQGGPVAVFDSTEYFLKQKSEPWVGFAEFYDYVHFTPHGAALMAEGIYGHLCREGLLPEASPSLGEGYATRYSKMVEEQVAIDSAPDFFARDWFLGIGHDRERLTSKDLWKYEDMAEELDTLLEADPNNMSALIYRGNRRSFQQGKTQAALEDWRKAEQLGGSKEWLRSAIEELEMRKP